MNEQTQYSVHLGISEKGKLYCLQGNYRQALRHFREAIRMVQNQPGSDIFFQHYSQCVTEALELSGAHQAVIDYCEKFIDFLDEKDEQTPMLVACRNLMLEKMAIQYLMLGDSDMAKETLQQVQPSPITLPVAPQLQQWLARGYAIQPRQIKALLQKNQYYIIRPDKVNPAIAMELPEAIAPF
jgi:tetratricopeptide (TPR) repeat protein